MLKRRRRKVRMNKLVKLLIGMTLTVTFLLSTAVTTPLTYATTTTLYIDPMENIFYSNTTSVGHEFMVKINVTDVTNMYAYELKILYNSTVLNGTSAVRPAGHFLEASSPTGFFVPVWTVKTENSTHDYWHVGYTLLAPETAKTGGGVLIELTFKILLAPPEEGYVSSPIYFFGVQKIADDTASPIPHDVVHGIFEYHWSPAPPPEDVPYLSVDPPITTIAAGAPVVGTGKAFFDVLVQITDADPGWWLVGAEFKLAYNNTLIDFVGIALDPWVESFGDIFLVTPTEGTRPDGLAYINTAVVLLPHDYPPSTWYNPISGNGPLVKITFEVIYQEAFPWEDESPLDLYEIKFSDNEAAPVPSEPEGDGQVIIKGFVIGRQVDVYTQYPSPYGGQGPNMPSDMFWPQKEVWLYANVTYNLWPVQNKVVAFEIRNACGELITILTAISDEDGVAMTTFRIPWPCDDPESLFGIWEVTATVDIACIVVNDTLSFHFDYLVRWVDVYTDKEEYGHCEDVKITVEYKSYAIQQRPVLITVVIHDELNYPIGYAYLNTTVGGGDMGLWCQYAYYSANFTIHVPKHAAAGIAKLYVNAYDYWPTNGGCPWVPEYAPPPEINILPEWA